MEVAVIDHLPGAVGVGRPEMVKRDPAAVDVLPPLVDNPAVGENPGCVVVLDVAGYRLDAAAVSVARVQDRHL
ncbi:MAG: hypothetical protein AMJ65_09235 [Phycisphaerae bacterium SG8_4]|nr:MAG: hypothetical protein AMJ65_09235 [Phycisphaerae bacterium SG8_4]